ncbi:MAG: ribosome maturation factor RimM [Alphaproteobacteria bacterium]|nr:ribosome maturation factor RimM [Alphaproteobacteria bacterium]MDD9919126.1 ribosome maturation factor RimM [Alphaproteobacteria bacterium]
MQNKLPAKEGYICLGVVTGAHGIKGEVKLKSFTDDPVDVGCYGCLTTQDDQKFSLKNVRSGAKGSIIAKIEGVDDRNASEALKGTALFITREALPNSDNHDILYVDFIGLTAQYENGDVLGEVIEIFHNGAHEVLEIQTKEGSVVLVPYVDEFVVSTNISRNVIVLAVEAEQFVNL